MGKVLSKDLYAILRVQLAPVMKRDGFQRLKGSSLGWHKENGGEYLSLWFQCDKYGWFESFGSRFTLEFQLGPEAEPGSWNLDRRARFLELLGAKEREVVRALNNEVLGSLPEPSPNHAIFQLQPTLIEGFLSGYRVQPDPYPEGSDVWLHYHTPQQAETWAAFLASHMRDMLVVFASKCEVGA